MNTLTILSAISMRNEGEAKGLIMSFLIAVLIIGAIGGLLYCIDRWIYPIPPPARMVIAIILVVCIIIWAINVFL